MANASVAVILVRLVFAVVVVVALLLLTARFTRRMGTKGVNVGRTTLRVIARQPLSRSASVAIVTAGSRTFVLGVTDQNVTLLSEHETTDEPTETPTEPARRDGTLPLANVVESLRERTLRR